MVQRYTIIVGQTKLDNSTHMRESVMKRFLVTVAAGLFLLTLPAIAFAGVAGSDHDLTGTGEKLCFACHATTHHTLY